MTRRGIVVIPKSTDFDCTTRYIDYNLDFLCLVAETVAQSKFCEGCTQAHDCKKVYEQLGQSKGSSVALGVVVAFLLPIIVFVVTLGVSGQFLANAVAQKYQTPAAFVSALFVTVSVMLVVSLILKRLHRNT